MNMISPISNPPLPGARHPANRGAIKQVPAKLRRFRSVRTGIKKRLDELNEQLQPLYQERNRLRNDVDNLARLPKPFLTSDQGDLERELKEARAGLASVEEIIDELATERDEITVDLDPLNATISGLEKHLGLQRGQQFIRPGEFWTGE